MFKLLPNIFHVAIALASLLWLHCAKSVRIRDYSGPHFSRIFAHSNWIVSPYSVRMRENAGKMRTRIISNTDTFYAVLTLVENRSNGWNTDMKQNISTAQQMKFSVKDFFCKCDQILNGKLHFLCSVHTTFGERFLLDPALMIIIDIIVLSLRLYPLNYRLSAKVFHLTNSEE